MGLFFMILLKDSKVKLAPEPTFNSLHSRESEKAGNISSYFCTASCETTGSLLKQWLMLHWVWRRHQLCFSTHLCIQHVYTEVTQCCLEEVIFGAVFQERTVHCVGSNLKYIRSSLCFKTAAREVTDDMSVITTSPAHKSQ